MNDIMLDNLALLSIYIIVIASALAAMEVIATLIYEWLESRLMYGNTKVGDILKPRAKKCNFTTTMRNILAKLGFN